MESFTPPTALPPDKRPRLCIEYDAGWDPQAGLDDSENRQIACSCSKSNHASSVVHVVVTVLTELSRLLFSIRKTTWRDDECELMINLRQLRSKSCNNTGRGVENVAVFFEMP